MTTTTPQDITKKGLVYDMPGTAECSFGAIRSPEDGSTLPMEMYLPPGERARRRLSNACRRL